MRPGVRYRLLKKFSCRKNKQRKHNDKMTQDFNLIETAFKVMKFLVPFLFALSFHEFAHGWVAKMRGDRTAEMLGRLTLNPLAHADLVGTIIFPIIAIVTGVRLIGWAKPVPVNERNLKNPRVDMFWIAFAGPLSNLFLALIGAIVLGLFSRVYMLDLNADHPGLLQINDVLRAFLAINVFLTIFNLIPLHPLDGGKVIARFLPENVNRRLEEMQGTTNLVLLILFVTGGLSLLMAGPGEALLRFFVYIARGVAVA
jgi:Zn-dependent protease